MTMMLALLISLHAAPALDQASHLDASQAGTPASPAGCEVFLLDAPKLQAETGRKRAEECALALRLHLDALSKAADGPPLTDNQVEAFQRFAPLAAGHPTVKSVTAARAHLIRAHRLYKNLKDTGLGRDENADVKAAGERVHHLMSRYGLRERLAAAFDSGVSWAETGNDTVRSARDSGSETKGRGLIKWETEHFGDDHRRPVDFSVGGSFGFVPVLTLVTVTDPATKEIIRDGEAPRPFATHFQGLMWDVAARLNLKNKARLENGVFSRFGHTIVTSDTDSFERPAEGSDKPAVVVLQRLRGGWGRAAHFLDIGFETRLYDSESMDQVHHEKLYLNPALHAAIGYRYDARFSDRLETAGMQPHRLLFTMALSVNRILSTRAEGEKPKLASFQFGVSYEQPLSRQAPAGLRFFFGPDLNLIKALKGES